MNGPSGDVQLQRNIQYRQRRNAPYPKIPRIRSLRSKHPVALSPDHAQSRSAGRRHLPRSPETDRTHTADQRPVPQTPETVLAGKTWRIYKVSPLYNFKYSVDKLKIYQKLLTSHIQAELNKGLAVGMMHLEEEMANAASIEKLDGLTINETDSEALQILLQHKKSQTNVANTVLTAVLCCVDVDPDYQRSIDKRFTHLPLLLVKGSLPLTAHLIIWLQSSFDCCVSQAVFRSCRLNWMLAMWAGFLPEGSRSYKRVELLYTIPTCSELSNVSMSIDARQCSTLWNAVHDEDNDDFTEEEVNKFVKSLEHHFYHHFKIKMEALRLSRIGTAIACVGAEGKVKMFSPRHIKQILAHLTEIIVEQRLKL